MPGTRGAARLAAVLALGLALTGCLGVGRDRHADARPGVAAFLAAAESGSDVGNDRPRSSFDGPMVRRREVLAFRVGTDADLPRLGRSLAAAGRRTHVAVFAISASVLDPADLERLAPDLVVALGASATVEDGERLMRRALLAARLRGLDVQDHEVARVLVHALRLTLRTAHPAAVSRAVDREGILTDALGTYTTRVHAHRLVIGYTGPLLSDALLRSVRRGVARPARVPSGAVAVGPRSARGAGVDLADEPSPPPADFSVAPHAHDD
jgi:hypothetical protein